MALQINIDSGGTLTDVCIMSDGGVKKTKVLTTPYDLSKCFFEGLQKASEGRWCTDQISTISAYVAAIENSLIDHHATQT
jgi:N-methylhydantoinase A/oxoprolinase/acetone carboxylase beta subunit